MRRTIGVVLCVAFAAFFCGAAFTEADTQPPPQEQQETAQEATIVKTVVKRPPRSVHRRSHYTVPSKPTPAEVREMISREATLWRVPAASLSRRVACESHFQWWASNGQYQGVLQFAPETFYRGMRTIRTLHVRVVETKFRRMHSRVYRHWSDGKVSRHRGRIVRQRVIVKRVGKIGNGGPVQVSNALAQVRIGAQALRGISAVHSSEWSCSA